MNNSFRKLILHCPVIHSGYLDFFARNKSNIDSIYLISEALVQEFSSIKPDIATIPVAQMRPLLESLGYEKVFVFTKEIAKELSQEPLVLIQDHISREIQKTYFIGSDIVWDTVFLRWDIDSVHTEDTSVLPESNTDFDKEMMKKAYAEAQKSSDWWRQVGAVLVRGTEVVNSAHNQGMPNEHTPYQRGAVRDFIAPGVQPELVDTIHAEQSLISQSARNGTALDGDTLYITHFPCPVCAKLIITAGIKKCFFAEGWSTLASAPLLESAGVQVTRVVL